MHPLLKMAFSVCVMGWMFVGLLIGSVVLVGCLHGGLPAQRAFERAAWQANRTTKAGPTDRAHMIDDLFERVLHAGMPRARVEAWLGPPTDRGYQAPPGVARWSLGYWTGDGFDADVQFLILRFDEAERLIAARAVNITAFGDWP